MIVLAPRSSRRRPVRRPAALRHLGRRRSTRSRPGPSSARSSASSSCRCSGHPARRRLAVCAPPRGPRRRALGPIAGRLYAISTAGSLVGTWLSALLLIPLVGTQRTFIFFAAVIALVAAVGLGWRFVVVPAALALALAIPVGTVKATEDGEVIYEAETATSTRGDRERRRRAAAGAQRGAGDPLAVQARLLPDRAYWDGLMVLPSPAARRSRRSGSRSSATRPARRHGCTGTTSPTTASTGSRSTAS